MPLLPYAQKNEKRWGCRGAGAAFCLVPLFWPRKIKALGLADDARDSKVSLAIASSFHGLTHCTGNRLSINRYAFRRGPSEREKVITAGEKNDFTFVVPFPNSATFHPGNLLNRYQVAPPPWNLDLGNPCRDDV